MSIFENLIDGLLGSDSNETAAKPYSNCAGDCSIYPDACEECQEYKKELLDQLYYVEHLDEYYAKYEIAGTGNSPVELNDCPCCGAKGQSGVCCEFCGTALRVDDGKIHVSGASEIPDPIQKAQEIIFSRHDIVKKYSSSEGTGLLSTLLNAVIGNDSFGSRMTTEQIKSTASAYGVTVSSYLAGLDNGVYLTSSAKEQQEKQEAEERQRAAAAAQRERMNRESERNSVPHHSQTISHAPGHPSHPVGGHSMGRPDGPHAGRPGSDGPHAGRPGSDGPHAGRPHAGGPGSSGPHTGGGKRF